VFDLIREHNLFTDVRDQVLLLVQFDDELRRQHQSESKNDDAEMTDARSTYSKSQAITLLVENIHSIPVSNAQLSVAKTTVNSLFRLCEWFNNSRNHHITCFSILML
jgi:hypothetical protein